MYVRPASSIVYHVIVIGGGPFGMFLFKCGRSVTSGRVGDGPRAIRPARVCVPCEREEISAT